MRKIFSLIILCLLLTSGCKQSKTFTIKGNLTPQILTGEVKLIRIDDKGYNRSAIDSTIIEKGQFVFKGEITTPGYYRIVAAKRSNSVDFILEEGEYTVTQDKYSMVVSPPVGSMQEKLQNYSKISEMMSHEINENYEKAEQEIDAKKKAKISDKCDGLFALMMQYELKNIRESKGTLLAHVLAYNKCYMFDRDFYYMDSLVQVFDGDSLKTYFRKDIMKKYNDLKTRDIRHTIAPDFTLVDIKGKSLTLSSFRNKIVLLDFWASWCGSCRKKNEHLKEIYGRIDKNKFEIISLSLDDKEKLWKEAVKHDRLTWIQIADLDGFKESKVKKMYHVENLPSLFLIDRDGRIVSVNPSLNDVEKYVNAN